MGWFGKSKQKRAAPGPADDYWYLPASGRNATSGVAVNQGTALTSTAVFAAVRVRAETVSSLPLPVYRRLTPRGKEQAPEHPLYRVLHDMANPEMTALEFRELMQSHLDLWGNAFSRIDLDGRGQVESLWPLRPDRMRITRLNDGMLNYEQTEQNGKKTNYKASNVLHIKGMGSNGIIGYSPITLLREAIGLSLATQEFGARFFANDASPKVVLTHPAILSPEASKRIKASWKKAHAGLSRAHSTALLEEGMDVKTIGVPPEDAQFLETRKFQISEIARIFRVPPHMIGDLERATFSNVEQQALDFVVHTIRPLLVRWEAAIQSSLFTQAERQQYFAEHIIDGLLRGDVKTRWEAYIKGIQNGVYSANDVRELENKNPLPGDLGNKYYMPLNMVEVTDQKPPPIETNQQKRKRVKRSATARKRIGESFHALFEEVALSLVRRERADVMRAVRKFLTTRNKADFDVWLQDFYAEHRGLVETKMLPVYAALAKNVQVEAAAEINAAAGMTPELEGFVDAYNQGYAQRHIASSQGQIRSIVRKNPDDLVGAISERMDEWVEKRPNKIARREIVEAGNAVTKAVFMAGGVTMLVWQTFGENCPFCDDLDGQVVGIQSNFLSAGSDFQPEGAEQPLNSSTDISHPPIHDGCDCQITAG